MNPDERRNYLTKHGEEFLRPLAKASAVPLAEARVLDMGSASGHTALAISPFVSHVTGVERNADYVDNANRMTRCLTNVQFVHGDIKEFADGGFDIVLCRDVIEHDKDQHGIVASVRRNLAPGGVYYLSTNNRLWPVEGHYSIPFLSYLPKRYADSLVRTVRGAKEFDIYPLTLHRLRRLLDEGGLTHELVPPAAANGFVQRVGTPLVRASPWFWNLANAFQVIGKVAIPC